MTEKARRTGNGGNSSPVTRREECRLCGSRTLELVLPILPSAIGDAFVSEAQLAEKQDTYPLDTYLCLDCGHLQNLDIVNPDILFRHYTYKTSASLGLVEHFRKYAVTVTEALAAPKDSLVVEIGSNDGSLLKAFRSLGMRVLGVDPAESIAREATEHGVVTLPEFFDSEVAKRIRKQNGPATIFCANNVFAHIDNMEEVVAGIHHLLAADGTFVFEVSYVPDIIDHMVFDTIYHEHVSHHALLPLERFFNRHDMTLFDVERLGTKGGSVRGYAQPRSTGRRPRSERLKAMFAAEERRGITRPDIYRDFFRAIEQRKHAVLNYLDEAHRQGERIVAYGASTTTTTLLYHFEIGPRIDFIVDDNPIKQGMFSPGFHLPVLSSSELVVQRPDIAIILAWTYWEPITKRNRTFIQQGGKFLIPLPELHIVGE